MIPLKKFPSKINWKWIPENFKCLWNKFFLNFWIKSNRNWFKKICPKIPQIPLEIICCLRLFSQSSSKDDEYARRQAIPLINSIGCEKGKYPDNWKRNIPIQIRCDQDSAKKKNVMFSQDNWRNKWATKKNSVYSRSDTHNPKHSER